MRMVMWCLSVQAEGVKQQRAHTLGAAISLTPFEGATCLWTDALSVTAHRAETDTLRLATLRAHYLVELVDLGFNVLSVRSETHFAADPYIEFKKSPETVLFLTTDTCRCVLQCRK